MESVGRLGDRFEVQKEKSAALLVEGRCDEATRALVELVPEAERDATVYFVLGNILYAQDPAASFGFHERAARAEPENPFVMLEWAFQLHRAGSAGEAERLYARLESLRWEGSGVPALRADCLLRLGRIEEAVAAWERSEPGEHHSTIEEAFSEVYGAPRPERRRCDLLTAISREDPSRIEELIGLDLEWDIDWWNSEANDLLLERDLRMAAGLLGRESPRYCELEHFVRVGRGEAFEDARERLEPYLSGEPPILFASSRVASLLFGWMLEQAIVDEATLLRRHGAELRRRAESDTGDLFAARILAYLYAETDDPRLAELDRLGWERYRDPRFAGSALASRGEDLKSDDPLLRRALEDFPDEPGIAEIALQCAEREGRALRPYLVRLILASFRRLESWHSVKEPFERLRVEIHASR